MADKTDISWTGATWNPITGCAVVSPGCTNCYAMKLAGTRLKNHPSRAGLTVSTKAGPVWNGETRFNEQWLGDPIRWKRPREIFVVAHGDLFYEEVPVEWIAKVWAVMAIAWHHRFQVLTKRSKRMRELLSSDDFLEKVKDGIVYVSRTQTVEPHLIDGARARIRKPLPNVYLGVSAEDQERADERVPQLMQTPAAVRWVSAEPLLGPINFEVLAQSPGDHINALAGCASRDASAKPFHGTFPRLDAIVTGGESQHGSRPMNPKWADDIRRQCERNGVIFHHKQNGDWAPGVADAGETTRIIEDGTVMVRRGVGKTGRELFGKVYDDRIGPRL